MANVAKSNDVAVGFGLFRVLTSRGSLTVPFTATKTTNFSVKL